MEKQKLDNLIFILGNIKDLRRRGWIKRRVAEPESDADHMYSVALQALLLAPPHLNRLHCLELALIHDLPEIYASDFTPGEISADRKYELELQAARRIAEELDFPQILDWFIEFETQSTPEARFVKSLDKQDNALTAAYYDRGQRSPQPLLKEFGTYAAQCVDEIAGEDKQICAEIIRAVIN